MQHLHVPLPEDLHVELRLAAERSGRPATELAREALRAWLDADRRARVADEIRAYAEAASGTEADLDPLLEASSVELLLAAEPALAADPPRSKRRRR